MEISEGSLTFCFRDGSGLKFDNTTYYRKYFNALPNGKGVDILHVSPSHAMLMEVKDCLGREGDNRWRIGVNNSKLHLAPKGDTDRDSFDIETAKKAAMTVACLTGAAIGGGREAAEELLPYFRALTSKDLCSGKKKLYVILFLDGGFGCKTRSKKTMMRELQHSIQRALKWLNCTVSVVDSDTYNPGLFTVKRCVQH